MQALMLKMFKINRKSSPRSAGLILFSFERIGYFDANELKEIHHY